MTVVLLLDVYTELVIDVFYIFKSTVVDWTWYIYIYFFKFPPAGKNWRKSESYCEVTWRFSDRASLYRIVSSYQLNAQFLYSITIYMLHYNPQHVSSSTLLIFRRTNCIITATLNRHTVRPFTESDNTSLCNNTILSSWRWA